MNRTRNLILAGTVCLATAIAWPAAAQVRHTQVHGSVRLGNGRPPQADMAVQVTSNSRRQHHSPRQVVPVRHLAPRHRQAPACPPPPVCRPPVQPVAHYRFANPLPVIRLLDARTRVYQPRFHGHPAFIQKRSSIFHPWVTVKSHPSIW